MTVVGPLELVLISFPKNQFKGEILTELENLVNADIIRVIDLLFVTKDKVGNLSVAEVTDLEKEEYKALEPVISESQGLLSQRDAEELSQSMSNDSSAGLVLFEDTWAKELADAVDRAGGVVVISERIPSAVVEKLATV
jgi:hypothetical protein